MQQPATSHRVVIIGAGFGGMEAAHHLAGTETQVTIVDQNNHHLFQPLLYQVATASLAGSEIAWPIRHLVQRHRNVSTVLAKVTGVDTARSKVVYADGGSLGYDTLIVATGARHAYFGHDEWEPYAPGLKTLEDAVTIRSRILFALEMAEREINPELRAALLNFVIVGGGPTGVELAGTIAELVHEHLRKDFHNLDTQRARVILIEAGSRILSGFTENLARYAHHALERLGVEVELGKPVSECNATGVVFGGRRLAASVILWAAGIQASPAADWLEAPVDYARRIKVEPDLTLPGHPDIFIIGDTAIINAWHGKPVPGIGPAAKQQGRHVALTIRKRLGGDTTPRQFRYSHAGSLATIGKRAAIIDFGWLKLRGWFAWWMWGLVHIYFLIGVRNRLAVALSWLWIYTTGDRSARLITRDQTGSRNQQ